MRTAKMSGVAGVHPLFGNGESTQWKMPVILALSAAGVIGLMMFGFHHRTEVELLKMQYMVQTAQDEAEGRVSTARRELALMTRKFENVENQMAQMRSELNKLQQLASQMEKKTERSRRVNNSQRKQKHPKGDGGLEDLGKLGGDVRITAADDDPTVGFKKGELL